MNVFNLLLLFLSLLTTYASADGLFITERKWKKSSVRVCWVDKVVEIHQYLEIMQKLQSKRYSPEKLSQFLEDYSESMPSVYKSTIKKIAQEQFSLEKIGIEFVGWGSCEVNKIIENKYDLLIIPENQPLSEKPARELGLATHFHIRRNDKSNIDYIQVNISDLENMDVNKLTLLMLHELGHALGLDHENIRARDNPDQFCQYFYWGGGYDNEAIKVDAKYTMETNPRALTSYDRYSVMNYCHLSTALSLPSTFIYNLKRDEYKKIYEQTWYFYLKPENDHWKNIFGLQSKRVSIYESKLLKSQLYPTYPNGFNHDKITVKLTPQISIGDIHALKCTYLESYRDQCKKQLNLESDSSLNGD